MSDAKLDEVDGEISILSYGRSKPLEVEKSLPDSGVEDGSNTCSLETGENTDDDDDEIVLKRPKKQKHQILDDDSDVSRDVPVAMETPTESSNLIQLDIHLPRYDMPKEVIDLREKRKSEFTPEQALEQVMANSSDDSDEDNKPLKKKRVKCPVSDDSSDEENVSLMDKIKKNLTKHGTDDLFDNEETSQQVVSDSENDEDKTKKPSILFDDDDSDSSGCKSSGSEVVGSDDEEGDAGFDESSVDPKLLAKLRKGAAKKSKDRSRRSKKDEKLSLHSESQRLLRESRVNIPYHQPAPKSINDFLERANRKQHEYKVLKGFRSDTKAKVIQDILQKTRIQSKAKTQEELDKYSDSDEDWNPDEEKEKSLKEKIDERIRNKSGGGMPLREIKLGIDSENSNQSSIVPDSDKRVIDSDEDDDELPDIDKNIATYSKHKESTAAEVLEGTSMDIVAQKEDNPVVADDTENDQVNAHTLEGQVNCVNENEVGDSNNEVLFDWEKSETCDGNVNDKCVDDVIEKDVDNCLKIDDHVTEKYDDNKENIDPNKLDEEECKEKEKTVVTPNHRKSTSPSSSMKKKRNKIASLTGIDLDSVKPCLSGNVESFITLEEEVEAPKHPGVQKLMDRLSKHSVKVEKKPKKDTDISVISKDAVGIDKEELKLNTFTYHSVEDDTNPLMKLETPGAKLVALKEQLKEKMKVRREMARQKRQEVYDLDNEEGGFEGEEEEAEMSEHSDTDVEEDVDEDFEEQFGTVEDEFEEEEEKERNPFADDEAEDDDDGDEADEEDNDDDDSDDDEEEFNLKLDVSDDENSGNEENADEDNSKSSQSNQEIANKPTEFKEPQEPTVLEKPFGMFGKRGRENSLGESQFQSGQTKSSMLPLPVEDSQDLYGSILPDMQQTQVVKSTQASQDFNFLLEDSQSNMLDADGYLKTKSTDKKKRTIPDLRSDDMQSQNMDELLGLCSGKFMESQAGNKDRSSRKTLFDDSSMSNTQGNMDELMGLCSGVFVDKTNTQATKESKKRKNSEVDSDEDSIEALSDNEGKDSENNGDSDDDNVQDDNDGDTDHVDSEGEDNPSQFKGFTVGNKHGKIRNEFVEAEAELSGSEYDSDENLDLAEEEDIMEIEEGDKDTAKMNEEKLRDEVGRVHLKQLIDEDKRELLRLQEMYLQDGDLHSEGGGRMRRFRWSNINDEESQQDMFNDGSDGEEHEEVDDFTWRKERIEREKYLQEQQEKEGNDADNSKFLKLGKVFLKKQVSLDNSHTDNDDKNKETGAETPGFPGSFYKLSQQKRGSFLARSKEALAKIAEMTKPVVNPSAGANTSGKFTFDVVSPDKDKEKEAPTKGKQRKAHTSKQAVLQSRQKQPPAKRPKLDTQSSFTENSIFHHI